LFINKKMGVEMQSPYELLREVVEEIQKEDKAKRSYVRKHKSLTTGRELHEQMFGVPIKGDEFLDTAQGLPLFGWRHTGWTYNK